MCHKKKENQQIDVEDGEDGEEVKFSNVVKVIIKKKKI